MIDLPLALVGKSRRVGFQGASGECLVVEMGLGAKGAFAETLLLSILGGLVAIVA